MPTKALVYEDECGVRMPICKERRWERKVKIESIYDERIKY